MDKVLITLIHESKMYFDFHFLETYYSIDYFEFHIHDDFVDLDGFQNKIINNNYAFVILPPVLNLINSQNEYVLEKINELAEKYSDTIFVNLDVRFPGVSFDKDKLKLFTKKIVCINDYETNEFENSIEIPLLGILNQDSLTQFSHIGNPFLKFFGAFNLNDFHNREYDIMLKCGKPKITRIVTAALLLKHNLNNFYTNISFSNEPNARQYEYDVDVFYNSILEKTSWDALDKDIKTYIKKIPIETYLGANSDPSKMKIQVDSGNFGYTMDVNSYAEMYLESETCDLKKINTYKNLVAFTEKTFNNFFYFKIPLAIDTRNNINYLKKIGFQFPITPCIIDSDDTLEIFYSKVDSWIDSLKRYNFKEMWNGMYYKFPFDGPLHKNHQLCKEFMYYKKDGDSKYVTSKLQYLTTYLFIEKYIPDKLEKIINWDYQSFLFLKEKKLIE